MAIVQASDILTKRNPGKTSGYMAVWDGKGKRHEAPAIVCKEILKTQLGWTRDEEVAAARRSAGTDIPKTAAPISAPVAPTPNPNPGPKRGKRT